jgi:uncharacterized membrane protein
MHTVLLFLHLAGVIVWVGGMFFAHFCLRPVVAEQLPPGPRLTLMAAVLGRFFRAVGLAVVVIVLSGLARMGAVGFARAPGHWHVMAGLGLLMAVIFAVIYLALFPRLRAGVAAQDWPAAGAALNRIRQLVAGNLLLGVVTVAVATLGAGLAG